MRNTLNIPIQEKNKMPPTIKVTHKLYRRLEGLAVGFDTPANVIERLLNKQDAEEASPALVEQGSNASLQQYSAPVQPELPASEFPHLHRIKGWAEKPQKGVARVVQKYIDLTTDNSGIDRDAFIKALQKERIYDGDAAKIKNNLVQMKGDHVKQNGRVFYDSDNRLLMYNTVHKEVLKYFSRSSLSPRSVPEHPDLPTSEFKKLHKIKIWAESPKNGLARIVQNYIDLTTDNSGIDRNTFVKVLQKEGIYDGDASKIKNNLAQMKGDKQKQHGKVFYSLETKLVMYDEVYEEVLKYFPKIT